ncbi:amidohydrolase family protein [Haliangium sp.]|uniref:amidohydrolase family protein n=1 Tax=Haliangium sp. TaxID=2663208 RepID=UPI003D0EC9C9
MRRVHLLWSVAVALMALVTWSCRAPASATAPVPGVSTAARDDVLALVDVHVVPMDREQILTNHTVLIRGQRIEAVGPMAEIPVPPQATVIEGHGRYLLPGLIDMHVHLFGAREMPLYVANGVTTVRNMAGSPAHLALREKIQTGELMGPTIHTMGPLIDGDPPYWPGSVTIANPAAAPALIAEQKAAGYDFIKLYMNLEPAPYRALVAAARAQGMKIAGHVPSRVGMSEVLAAPLDSLEHLWGYFLDAETGAAVAADRHATIVAEARSWADVDDAQMKALAEALAAAKVWSCPTLTVRRRLRSAADPEALTTLTHGRYISPQLRALWGTTPMSDLSPEGYDALAASYDPMQRMTRALRDAGARILLGTDTPNPLIVPGFSVHDELASLVGAGLTPYQALRAGTRDAAEFLGVLDDRGTVTTGRRADLVLVRGDPLVDVGHAAQIEGVVLRGQWLPPERLQQMLDDMVASFSSEAPKLTDEAPEGA